MCPLGQGPLCQPLVLTGAAHLTAGLQRIVGAAAQLLHSHAVGAWLCTTPFLVVAHCGHADVQEHAAGVIRHL